MSKRYQFPFLLIIVAVLCLVHSDPADASRDAFAQLDKALSKASRILDRVDSCVTARKGMDSLRSRVRIVFTNAQELHRELMPGNRGQSLNRDVVVAKWLEIQSRADALTDEVRSALEACDTSAIPGNRTEDLRLAASGKFRKLRSRLDRTSQRQLATAGKLCRLGVNFPPGRNPCDAQH